MVRVSRIHVHPRNGVIDGTNQQQFDAVLRQADRVGRLGGMVELGTLVTRANPDQDYALAYAHAHVRVGLERAATSTREFRGARFVTEILSVSEFDSRLSPLRLRETIGSSDCVSELGVFRCGDIEVRPSVAGQPWAGTMHGANKFSSRPCWAWSLPLRANRPEGALVEQGTGQGYYSDIRTLLADLGGLRTPRNPLYDTRDRNFNIVVDEPRAAITGLVAKPTGELVVSLDGVDLRSCQVRATVAGEQSRLPAAPEVALTPATRIAGTREVDLIVLSRDGETIDRATFLVEPEFVLDVGQLLTRLQPRSWRILLVTACPTNYESLRLGAEQKVIREAVERTGTASPLRLAVRTAATVHDLRHAMLETAYDIIHIAGHSNEQWLLLEREDGNASQVPIKPLFDYLRQFVTPTGGLECLVLNSCWSSDALETAQSPVPYTIAMNGPVDDDAAIEFSRGFYDALALGHGIERAFAEGRHNVALATGTDGYAKLLVRKPD